ncbi:MAG: glycosyltransferase 87 family protein, partial [Anaerolineae bacterium]
ALELYDRSRALKCAWFYTGLFVPLYMLTSSFDSLPLFLILLSLYLLLNGRAWSSGASLGLGFMVKITPLVFLPVGLRALKGMRRKLGYLVAAGLTIALLTLLFLGLFDADLLVKPFLAAWRRSSWETVWAVLEGYYSYGVVGGDRLDPSVVDFSVYPSSLPWLWISLVFALIYLWLYTRRTDYGDKIKVVALAGLTLNLFLLYSKGYSPQFLVYVLPFVVSLLPDLRGVVYATLLTFINFLEQPLYFVMFPDEHWVLVGIVVGRTLLLIMLCVEYGSILFSLSWPWLIRWRRRALASLAILMLLAGCPASYRLSQAYYSARYAQEEYRPAIGFLRTQVERIKHSAGVELPPYQGKAALIFSDQSHYRRFYPFLRHGFALYAFDSSDADWAGRLREVKEEHAELWLWRGGRPDRAIEGWLNENSRLVASYAFDQEGTLLFYSREEPPPSPPVLADLGDGIRLVAYRLGSAEAKPGGKLNLTLYWKCLREMERSYTVFTHLLNEGGQLLVGKDNPPVGGSFPTSQWAASQLIEDEYTLILPPDTPSGEYTIEVGMYDPTTGQRLVVIEANGHPRGDRILLGEVRVRDH